MRKPLLVSVLLLCTFILFAQEKTKAFEINERLGRGVNMGNSFEAPSETEWGNPWKPEYFKMMADLGFDHVRVPIRWEPSARSMAGAPYTIKPEFLERIKSVVDEALKNKLHIIINMHHHEALIKDPDGQKDRFLSQWTQISEYFQSYSDSLLFELLNEPNDKMTAEKWNVFATAALKEIRKTNPDRTVVVGPAEWGGIGGLSKLKLPEDDNLILTIHYYSPFEFTHQGADWSDMEEVKDVKWFDSESERSAVQQDFEYAKAFAEANHIPIHVGEFGAYSKADIESRVRWTTYLARWFEEQGFSWAYWEFSAGFGIYDPATGKYVQPLVDALLKNTIPEPAQTIAVPVYENDFQTGNDGWSVGFQGGASGTYAVEEGRMKVHIETAGKDGWHIQLMQFSIPLEKGKNYRLSMKASASADFSISNYIGQNGGDWGAYTDYNIVAVSRETKEFVYHFTMTKESDTQARIVFDLGGLPANATFYLNSFKLEEVTIIPNGISQIEVKERIPFYFSPNQSELFLLNEKNYTQVAIYSLSGTLQLRQRLTEGLNQVDVSKLNAGTWLIRVDGTDPQTLKVLKRK